MWLLLTPSAGVISQLPCWPHSVKLNHAPSPVWFPLRPVPRVSSPHLPAPSCPTKRGQRERESSCTPAPKSHYHPVACCLGQRPGRAFRLAEVGTVGFRTRGLSPPLPKGEGLQGTSGLTQSSGLTPLALQVASCPGNAWERAVLTSSVLHVSFPTGGAW